MWQSSRNKTDLKGQNFIVCKVLEKCMYVYLDDRVLGSCRPVFSKKKLAVVQFQSRFFVHENAENWRCSIFGTPEIGDTPNLASDSDSPSLLP